MLTGLVKQELSRVRVARRCCRKAEVSVMLRLAGGLRVADGRIVVEARLDTAQAAQRLGRNIAEVFRHHPEMITLGSGGEDVHVVRVSRDGASLARMAGLLDGQGRAVRGLAPQAVSGAVCDAEAVWRAAFLACGSLTGSGRSSVLEVACPGLVAAVALAGAARRLAVTSQISDRSGVDRVVIHDDDMIAAMLVRLGTVQAVQVWQEQRTHNQARALVRLAGNFKDANIHRSAHAAALACTRVERALRILTDGIPEHLQAAVQLRLRHRQASWEELAQLSDPPMTKDTIAGRIRRLLTLADQHALRLGIPDTTTPNPDLRGPLTPEGI